MKLLPPLSRNTCPIKQRRQRNRSLKAYPKCKITIFRTLFDSVIYILPQRYSQVRRQTACLIKHKFISSKPLSSYLIYRIYSSRAGPGGQSVVNLIRHACILWRLLYYVRRRNHEESCYHLFCIADTAFLVQPSVLIALVLAYFLMRSFFLEVCGEIVKLFQWSPSFFVLYSLKFNKSKQKNLTFYSNPRILRKDTDIPWSRLLFQSTRHPPRTRLSFFLSASRSRQFQSTRPRARTWHIKPMGQKYR